MRSGAADGATDMFLFVQWMLKLVQFAAGHEPAWLTAFFNKLMGHKILRGLFEFKVPVDLAHWTVCPVWMVLAYQYLDLQVAWRTAVGRFFRYDGGWTRCCGAYATYPALRLELHWRQKAAHLATEYLDPAKAADDLRLCKQLGFFYGKFLETVDIMHARGCPDNLTRADAEEISRGVRFREVNGKELYSRLYDGFLP